MSSFFAAHLSLFGPSDYTLLASTTLVSEASVFTLLNTCYSSSVSFPSVSTLIPYSTSQSPCYTSSFLVFIWPLERVFNFTHRVTFTLDPFICPSFMERYHHRCKHVFCSLSGRGFPANLSSVAQVTEFLTWFFSHAIGFWASCFLVFRWSSTVLSIFHLPWSFTSRIFTLFVYSFQNYKPPKYPSLPYWVITVALLLWF